MQIESSDDFNDRDEDFNDREDNMCIYDEPIIK